MFRIFKTVTYDQDYELLDKSEQLRVDAIASDLFDCGDVTGKPLGVSFFFREKKFGGKRILYLVYLHFTSGILGHFALMMLDILTLSIGLQIIIFGFIADMNRK